MSQLTEKNVSKLSGAGSKGPKSQLSRASKQPSAAGSKKAPSIATSEANRDIDEDDEWTAIQKFNALLHYQEAKQAKARAD